MGGPSILEHADLLLKLLGVLCAALLALLSLQWRQLLKRIDDQEHSLLMKIAEHSTARQSMDTNLTQTRETVVRIAERLDGYVRAHDLLIADFRAQVNKSDTLHMAILSRLGKLQTGRTPSPDESFDNSSGDTK